VSRPPAKAPKEAADESDERDEENRAGRDVRRPAADATVVTESRKEIRNSDRKDELDDDPQHRREDRRCEPEEDALEKRHHRSPIDESEGWPAEPKLTHD
jgi:hypothetical protein